VLLRKRLDSNVHLLMADDILWLLDLSIGLAGLNVVLAKSFHIGTVCILLHL
jgi:hypothetical protein